jgi:hypothetical protein
MLKLSASQNIFLNGLNTKFRSYVGGFGSGKTFIGCIDLLNFFGKHPGTRQGYFGLSFPAIRDIFYPTFEEAAEMMGFTVTIREANKEVHVYRNGFYYGTVICRSMDKPENIVGFKISRALVDEIDVLKPEKAEKAWNKIIARLRLKIDGVENSIGVTTTPEGFLFVYNKFADEPTEKYSMVQASTFENQEYLPDDYIDSLYETYSEDLANAYVMGEFVNLTSGTVYRNFNRILNNSTETIKAGEDLHIGMDFNVGKMAAVIHVKRKGLPHAVGEIMGLFDTPAMISDIESKFPDHNIYVYPDASGKNRKTVGASETDISLLKKAGFRVRAKDSNPYVRDRVNNMNSMFCNKLGERKYFINTKLCPEYTKCLEQQAYNDKGEPDKTKDNDHGNDAAGYFISYDYKINKPARKVKVGFAI